MVELVLGRIDCMTRIMVRVRSLIINWVMAVTGTVIFFAMIKSDLEVSKFGRTPVYTESKLKADGDPISDPTLYRSLAVYYVMCVVLLVMVFSFINENLLSWSAKRQVTLSRSSDEAEYRGVANVVAETTWVRNLLCELHAPLFTTTLVYCDNVSAVYLSTNPVQHRRTKHIEIDIHFVRDFVASRQVRVLHVPS
uniref:NBS-containing resistance-like protein n=1 Tax=Tanacetum cinerariifolium TaxID=118510 RepID=A0A699K0S2_TANCI|nr:NBS-containing resistance-like protein [Tanacetum cinerariifolium]